MAGLRNREADVSALAAKAWQLIGIRGAIAIVLGLLLIFVMVRADAISEDLADTRAELRLTESKLKISNASIDTLEAKLADFIGAGAAARVAQLEAIEAQAADSADLQREADAIRAEMAALVPEDGQCVTPGAILDSGGL